MKAIIVRAPGGLDRIERVELPDPGAPGPGAIRVRLHASSLNFHDYGVVSTPNRVSDGRIPMSDGAGLVESIGDGVSEFKAGDHVVSCFFPYWMEGPPPIADFSTVPGDGVDGYARELVVAPSTAFTHAPKGYSFTEAATLPTAGVTAWRALVVNGALKAGDTVLVLGTGGVSIFALQIAKAMGATVIATSSSDEKLKRVRALGADHTINYRHHPDWGARVREWTGGSGVDHVVEVGGPGTLYPRASMKGFRRTASRRQVSASLHFIHTNKISNGPCRASMGTDIRLSVEAFVLVIEGRCRRISALPNRDHIHAVEVCATPNP